MRDPAVKAIRMVQYNSLLPNQDPREASRSVLVCQASSLQCFAGSLGLAISFLHGCKRILAGLEVLARDSTLPPLYQHWRKMGNHPLDLGEILTIELMIVQ